MRRGFGSSLGRVHGIDLAGYHVVVDPVLEVGRAAGGSKEPLPVRLVLGEEERRVPFAVQIPRAQVCVGRRDHGGGETARHLGQLRLGGPLLPGPGVPEPEGGEHMEGRRRRTPVCHADLDQQVLGIGLGVLHKHVEVPVLVEHARIEKLVLQLLPCPAPVCRHQVIVGEGGLGVLVEVFHVRMGRRAVEVEVVLLHVLPMIPLAVGQTEEALLEDGVLPVPEREREAEPLLVIGDARQAVLAPPIGPGASLIVREVVPGVPKVAVILPNSAPLPLAEVWAPLTPRRLLLPGRLQSDLLCCQLPWLRRAFGHGRTLRRLAQSPTSHLSTHHPNHLRPES